MKYCNNRSFAVYWCVFLGIITQMIANPVYSFQPADVELPADSRYLIIHLDGISSEVFIEKMENGVLPNISAYFDDSDIIDHAITYFPSKTPNVITSIREGIEPEEARFPGWQFRNRDPHSITRMPESFFKMAFSTSRISVTNLMYGIPGLHWMAGIALQNSADFLQEYPVLQFYWFPTDTQGHFNGEEAYRREIRRFDRQFGKLIERLHPMPVNIIIYSDHGIAFGEGNRPDSQIETLIGDDLDFFSYPAIFLNDGVDPSDYAEQLLIHTELDFVFYLNASGDVTGLHEDGEMKFLIRDDKIKYEFSDSDILGYSDLGYKGEYLTRDEWLKLTHSSRYPGATINIVHYLNNIRSGEMVVLYDKGKYYQTGYSQKGNHGGFIHHEMSVPLLLKGPDLADFVDREYYWIPDLFQEIEGLNFNVRPNRENHAFRTLFNFKDGRSVTELEISPTYRVSYGITYFNENHLPSFKNNFNVWGKADLYRSYISRVWVGAAVVAEKERHLPVFLFQYDLNYRKWSLETRLFTTQNVTFNIGYQMTDWLRVESVNFNSAGIRLTL